MKTRRARARISEKHSAKPTQSVLIVLGTSCHFVSVRVVFMTSLARRHVKTSKYCSQASGLKANLALTSTRSELVPTLQASAVSRSFIAFLHEAS